nr:HEAT repeat domain-containing protein [Actinomycetota bacterium]
EQTTLERLLTADLDTDVRYTALSMLHLGGWFDKSTLTVMLDDPSESIQAAALRMLVEHDRAYLDRTVRLLEGDEGPLRRVALELLRDFGSEEHVDALVRASLRYEPHYPAGMVWCQNAVRALASIGGAEARRALSRLLCTAHAKVARVALEELQSMGGPLEEILIDVLKSDDEADHRSAAAVNLDGAVSASVRAALVAALVGDEASDVRMACARSLAAGGPGQDVSVLIDAARREGDDRVRAAILDVVSLGDRSVLPDVRAILEDAPDTAGDRWLAALGDPDATVRILDRLYDAPRTSSGTYQAVFKDYAEAVCGVARYSGGVGLRPSYDQSQSRKAIAWLCGVDTPASSNVLHHAARLPDTSVVSGFVEVPYDHAHPTGTETHTKTLSFAYVRDAAVAELTERGNPPYDQSVYAKTGCWVLPEVYRGE